MKRALILTFGLCIVGTAAFAGTQDNAVVALHDTAKAVKAITTCTTEAPAIECSNYSVDNAPNFSARDIYLVVANADAGAGIAGVSCGLAYTGGPAAFGWTLCADLDFPNSGWPGNGGGDRITWAAGTNCQVNVIGGDGVHAVAGAIYVYSYGDGEVCVTPNTFIPEFKVADCAASESDVTAGGGKVGFGTLTGFNPCNFVVPVEETTWGSIKALGNGE